MMSVRFLLGTIFKYGVRHDRPWKRNLTLLLFSVVFIAIIPSSTIQYDNVREEIAGVTASYHFDFIAWELGAIRAKADSLLFGQVAYMTEADRSQYVRDYMTDLQRLLLLDAQITSIYSDATISNPASQTIGLRSERDHVRALLTSRQLNVESILEGQVATILVEEGFGTLGQLLPPMAMRFTQMPDLLVTSPRDQIRMENSLVVDPLPVEDRVALENDLMQSYDISAIVVPLGGIALYPAMVLESSDLSFVIETFAHEWLHHYLYFHPLGLSYFSGEGFAGEARIINETTADLFGKEIAAGVIERYYPELTPPRLNGVNPIFYMQIGVNQFDFAAEMNQTRAQVDALLTAGEIDAAETYMEERRLFFLENGYALRRINQAFFAFYGGYQAGGGIAGAGGTDPIGPAVMQVREQSPSVYVFIQTMQSITSREQLLNTGH